MQDLSADGAGDDWRNHLVNLEQICLSRDEGNLCIVNVVAKNLSLLGKWVWLISLEMGYL